MRECTERERELSTNLCPYIWRHINKIEIEICLNNTGCHIWNFMHLVSTEKEFLILIDNVNLTFKCNRQNHCKFLWSDSNTRTYLLKYKKKDRQLLTIYRIFVKRCSSFYAFLPVKWKIKNYNMTSFVSELKYQSRIIDNSNLK